MAFLPSSHWVWMGNVYCCSLSHSRTTEDSKAGTARSFLKVGISSKDCYNNGVDISGKARYNSYNEIFFDD